MQSNKDGYIEQYPHQIGISLFMSYLYQIFNTNDYMLIRIINVIANISMILALYQITKTLAQKYQVNPLIYFILITTFSPLILLSTFVYGDYIGLAFASWGIYFAIRYTQKGYKVYNIITAAIFLLLAYIIKMNYIIMTIATAIYLILDIIQTKEKIAKKSILIIIMLIIVIIPNTILMKIYSQKLECNENKSISFPTYLYMGMSESYRANGWYGHAIEQSWTDPEQAAKEYPHLIKERLIQMLQSPVYTIGFYYQKTISGWTDPMYASIWYNLAPEVKDVKIPQIENQLKYQIVNNYQKGLVLLIFLASFIALTKNRKNLSLEVIFLTTIFIGGFLFHTLWEMKTRYVLPFVILLIPLATIGIEPIVNKVGEKVEFLKEEIKQKRKRKAEIKKLPN